MAVKILISVVTILMSLPALCQKSIDDIDLGRIRQKKVREFILNQKMNRINFFEELRVSFSNEDDTSEYKTVKKLYLIKENIASVWDSYITNDLSKAWNGNMVSFGASFSRLHHNFNYGCENFVGAETGQILFLNLKLLKGLYNLAVAFEITEIDPVKKIIVFNYVDGGKAKGEQIIKFRSTEDGFTIIEHKTFFRSNSEFRDKRLYPFFHLKLIDEFHENIWKVRTGNLASS